MSQLETYYINSINICLLIIIGPIDYVNWEGDDTWDLGEPKVSFPSLRDHQKRLGGGPWEVPWCNIHANSRSCTG